MKKVSFVIVLGYLFVSAYSQPCLPDGITFSTQSQIDSFQINYPNCSEIEGQVWISGNAITNFNGLTVLTIIWGDLVIYSNNALTSLTGLENITSIGGNLEIHTNNALTSLTGLENMSSIGGDLRIYGNYALTSLTGFENLSSIDVDLVICGTSLTSLTGLFGLTSIGGMLHIGCPAPSGGNLLLESLTGLEGLTSIGGILSIEYNPALTSLEGIDNIDAGSITVFKLDNNGSLSNCEVKSVCDYLVNPTGTFDIHDNGIGCNSPEEVLDSCEAHAGYIDIEINEGDIIIYPNPADKELNISVEGFTIDEVAIFTLTGQRVYAIKPKSETINISTLHPGMYIVEVTVENNRLRQKLLVQR